MQSGDNKQAFKWIAVGDIHDQTDNFSRIPELRGADGIIITGDLTVNGGARQAKTVLESIRAAGLPVVAQIGNMDLPEVNDWLEEQGVNLHGHTHELAPGLVAMGIGGSTLTPFNTPSEFTEDAYRSWLEKEWQKASRYPLQMLVSHNPPSDTACDDIGNGIHPGSKAVREFIETHQPALCICGHIHEGKAQDRIGQTLIVNPGMLAEGGYVVVTYQNGALEADLKQLAETE